MSAKSSTAPPAIAARQTTKAIDPTVSRLRLTGAPVSRITGMLRIGRPSSVAVEISETAVTLVAARVGAMPARLSMSNCMAPPAAAPPGTMRLKALPASCAVATGNHSLVESASFSSAHMHMKLRTSTRTIGTIQSGLIVASLGPELNTLARLGHTT